MRPEAPLQKRAGSCSREQTAAQDVWPGKSVQKILVFLDDEARASFGERSWACQSLEEFGVETYVCPVPVPVPDHLHQALVAAQTRQDLRVDG